MRLLRLGAEEHVLVLVIHHIVTDGWSMSILFEEIAQFYGRLALGRQPELATLPIQYTDIAYCHAPKPVIRLPYW